MRKINDMNVPKLVSKRHMDLEIELMLNKKLYEKNLINYNLYDLINNELIKEIENEGNRIIKLYESSGEASGH